MPSGRVRAHVAWNHPFLLRVHSLYPESESENMPWEEAMHLPLSLPSWHSQSSNSPIYKVTFVLSSAHQPSCCPQILKYFCKTLANLISLQSTVFWSLVFLELLPYLCMGSGVLPPKGLWPYFWKVSAICSPEICCLRNYRHSRSLWVSDASPTISKQVCHQHSSSPWFSLPFKFHVPRWVKI